MLRRVLAVPLILWALGFIWFAVFLPQPAPQSRTDAIVVPTGSGGRIQRGLEMLQLGAAEQMLVTGVDISVQPGEFQVQFEVPQRVMDCFGNDTISKSIQVSVVAMIGHFIAL